MECKAANRSPDADIAGRLIGNIVECKVNYVAGLERASLRLIGNIVECKAKFKITMQPTKTWINRKHSGM